MTAIELLDSDLTVHLVSQLPDLTHKLGSEGVVIQLLHVLEVFLMLSRPHHGEAVFVWEVARDEPPDLVLLLYLVTQALLLLQGVLKVLSRANAVVVLIQESKTEVSDDPQKGGKVGLNLLGIHILCQLALYLELFRQVDDERQLLQSCFVNRAHRVVDEVTR